MLAAERRNKLVSLINTYGSLRVGDMARMMKVTTETIRKDLLYLSEHGLVEKQFGGALAITENEERPIGARSMENNEIKERIALRALDFLTGNIVFVDAGSTLLTFAQRIPAGTGISYITNSFRVVDHLADIVSSLHFIGGEVSSITGSTSGFWCAHELSTLNMDVAFLGSSGFQFHNGPCTKGFQDAKVKQDVIKSSRQNIVLADGSKFQSNAVVQYATWDEIDVLITDSSAPSDMVEELRKHLQVEVV